MRLTACLFIACARALVAPRRHLKPPALAVQCAAAIADALDAVAASLPIAEVLDEARAALRDAGGTFLWLEAPPGAGKTTVVPLAAAADTAGGLVVVVEPRRVAARAAARRMAASLGESVGETVGFAIRGESARSAATRVLVVTDGVFLAMAREDPSLAELGVCVFDEFHERGLDGDAALALARAAQTDLRGGASPLRIVVMSATLFGEDGGAPAFVAAPDRFEIPST